MTHEPSARPAIVIEEGLRDGAHGAVVAMHSAYYARAWRFDAFFEQKVAAELAEFISRMTVSTTACSWPLRANVSWGR